MPESITRPHRPTDEGQSEERWRLLAEVRLDAPVPQLEKDLSDTEFTWPHLVVWEFIAAVVFTLALLVISWLINAPLVEHANPNLTPNPAKAPWYFLNLQELLLHMHPALAGVIIPGLLLLLLMAVPYVDQSLKGAGRWFTAEGKGTAIASLSAAYTTVLVAGLIVFDEFVGTRRLLEPLGVPRLVIEMAIPVLLMVGLPTLLVYLVRHRWRGITGRETLIALFFGFVTSYVVLTVVGTAFRGPGMHLYWPWAMPPAH